jgi:hypothetical protein
VSTTYSPVDTLNDPQVKSYFLGILESSLAVEEKYQRFIDFFAKELAVRYKLLETLQRSVEPAGETRDLEEKLQRVADELSESMGVWKPERIISHLQVAIRRAIGRLRNSQHWDKGWGATPDHSESWGTAFAVLCLKAASTLSDMEFDVDIDDMLRGGISWLETHPEAWSVDYIGSTEGKDVLDTSLAICCFLRTPREYIDRVAAATSRSVEILARMQNEDGGWDAKLWGAHVGTLTRVWSYVPSTSFALQALAETREMKFRSNALKALTWLIQTQNEDGSWNYGSCQPGTSTLSGLPMIVRTCEALQGIIAATTVFEVRVEGMEHSIAKAVEWIKTKEKPIFDSDRNIKGWGFFDDDITGDRNIGVEWGTSLFDFENTCLTVETLAQLPQTSLPLLSANVKLLGDSQVKRDNDPEDGNWPLGHTARIAHALIKFYERVRAKVRIHG